MIEPRTTAPTAPTATTRTAATPSASPLHLTSGRLLARNTIWNLIGNGAPMLVALFAIPILIHTLGKDRFGVLALAWALIGYASLFDMGLGRALTQLVARKLGEGFDQDVPALVWTSILLMLAMGIVGAAIIAGISPWLVHSMLKIPEAIQPEALRAFVLLGLSVPVVITTAGLRGLLEAYQRFGLINALRIPMGMFSFAGPLLVLPFSRNLFPVVAVLVGGRVVGCGAHLFLCFRVLPSLRHAVLWQRSMVKPLLQFGSWMTVTNIVGPLMVTFDRFVIGALLSVAAVAYYTTPSELVSKLWLIPSSLLAVMFPAFSTSFVQDRSRASMLYARSIKYLVLTLFPIILLIVVLAQEGLKIWLGADFASHSVRVLQWLAVGAFINCLASAPFAVVQGAGRPDLTAKLHLIELPLYFGLLFWLTKAHGIEGAAIAWTARVAIDALVLFAISKRVLAISSALQSQTVAMILGALGTFALAALIHGWEVKGLFIGSIFLGFVLLTWFILLSPEERKLAQQLS
jgi:O-antigen/teichoic acid export membrane protein